MNESVLMRPLNVRLSFTKTRVAFRLPPLKLFKVPLERLSCGVLSVPMDVIFKVPLFIIVILLVLTVEFMIKIPPETIIVLYVSLLDSLEVTPVLISNEPDSSSYIVPVLPADPDGEGPPSAIIEPVNVFVTYLMAILPPPPPPP